MDVALNELVGAWRGKHATLDIDLAPPEGRDAQLTHHYEGILDGPYLGDGPGIGLVFGARTIQGDIAVEGPYIDFEPAQPDGSPAILFTETYAEIHVTELPLVAHVEAGTARWESRLADGRAVRCRLSTAGTD